MQGWRLSEPLQQLERIELFRTRTTSKGAAALAELKSLKISWKLDYTSVDDKGVESLKGVTST